MIPFGFVVMKSFYFKYGYVYFKPLFNKTSLIISVISEKILKTNHFENILIERAEGVWIFDQNKKKYLDCSSGIWCCNIGHNHPDVKN